MRSRRNLPGNDKKPFQPPDTRIFLLLLLCAAIILRSGWDLRPAGDQQSAGDRYELKWRNNTLMLSTHDDGLAGKPDLPAHLAPFFFEKITINQASPLLLQIIPGIGPELAVRIIVKRDERGGFSSPEQLLEVPGIGLKRKDKLTAWLSFE